jgi:hypothetical protein
MPRGRAVRAQKSHARWICSPTEAKAAAGRADFRGRISCTTQAFGVAATTPASARCGPQQPVKNGVLHSRSTTKPAVSHADVQHPPHQSGLEFNAGLVVMAVRRVSNKNTALISTVQTLTLPLSYMIVIWRPRRSPQLTCQPRLDARSLLQKQQASSSQPLVLVAARRSVARCVCYNIQPGPSHMCSSCECGTAHRCGSRVVAGESSWLRQ